MGHPQVRLVAGGDEISRTCYRSSATRSRKCPTRTGSTRRSHHPPTSRLAAAPSTSAERVCADADLHGTACAARPERCSSRTGYDLQRHVYVSPRISQVARTRFSGRELVVIAVQDTATVTA